MATKKVEEKTVKSVKVLGKDILVKDIALNDIIAVCKEKDEIAWLKETAAKTFPKKSNPEETRKITFVELKAEWMNKFYPEAVGPKEKEPTMFDIIANL